MIPLRFKPKDKDVLAYLDWPRSKIMSVHNNIVLSRQWKTKCGCCDTPCNMCVEAIRATGLAVNQELDSLVEQHNQLRGKGIAV